MNGPPVTSAGWAAWGGVAKAVLDSLTALGSPEVIQALNPSMGLQVTPAVFQSIEQEGRWKPVSFVAPGSSARQFELAGHAEKKPPPKPRLRERYAPLEQASARLFTIKMPAKNEIIKVLGGMFSDSSLTTYATWWTDGLEIWGGYAGLHHATGFLNVYHHRANISFQAIPFGNYFPALALITWSGWVSGYDYNQYFEFRGAIALRADNQVLGTDPLDPNLLDILPGEPVRLQSGPGYMTYWTRNSTQTAPLTWDTDNGGFVLDGSIPFPYLKP